jgi:hypothetical protein
MALLEQAFPAHLRRRRPRPEEAVILPDPDQCTYDPRPPEKRSYRNTPPRGMVLRGIT